MVKRMICGLAFIIMISHPAEAGRRLDPGPDVLEYQGIGYTMLEYPLNDYCCLPEFDEHIEFDTGNDNDYRARWKIEDDRLDLIVLEASLDGRPARISEIFPGKTELPVPADWYTGQITLLAGDTKWDYSHAEPERYIVFQVKEGRVLGMKEVHNDRFDEWEDHLGVTPWTRK